MWRSRHWILMLAMLALASAAIGQPTGPGSYQSPRDFNVSVGFRF